MVLSFSRGQVMQFSHLEENVGFQSWYLLFKGFVDWYTTVVSQPRPKRKGEMVTKCLVCKTIVWYSWFWLASNILARLMVIFSFTTAYDLITDCLRCLCGMGQVQKHFQWNTPPIKYDAFHMVMYELWLRHHVIKY